MVATAWPHYITSKDIIDCMKSSYLKLIYKILAFYARRVILKNNPKVIVVTGSVGKTSTKDAIFEVLKDAFGSKVRKSEGNLNAEIGIPLTILGYKKVPNKYAWPFFLLALAFKKDNNSYPDYLILEMGVEKAGDIDYFTTIVRPDIAIITAVTAAHLSNFKNLAEYQDEKLAILTKLKPQGKVVINIDDTVLAEINNRETISVSASSSLADYYADNITVKISGTEFRINYTGHKISIKSPLLGRQTTYCQLFGFAIGEIFGISSVKIGKSLSSVQSIPGRMNLIEGKNETCIIDDTYNSSPTSAKAALLALSEIEHKGRKVAIIGNMNELGKTEKEAHIEVGKYATDKCDLAVFVGPNAKIMSEAFGKKSQIFPSRVKLIESLPDIIEKGDLILVKASQNGNFFEEVVKFLMENPSDAKKLLVRQDRLWKNKKY